MGPETDREQKKPDFYIKVAKKTKVGNEGGLKRSEGESTDRRHPP
jgi:hypothetical protein